MSAHDASQSRGGWDVPDLARPFALGNHKIISSLEIEPKIRAVAAQSAKPQRHRRGSPAASQK